MSRRRGRGSVALLAVPALALAPALGGCESTQAKSARLKREGVRRLAAERGLDVQHQNPDVKVRSTAVLHDENGVAVVVALQNRLGRPLGRVPVAIDVKGADGRQVYANDVPGLDPSLVEATGVPAGGELLWVDDQITASAAPKAVDAVVGRERGAPPRALPRIEVDAPRLANDAVTGVEAIGVVHNRSQVDQRRLVVAVVARRGGQVVAAGRAIVERLLAGRAARYHVFFIGDPRGAQLAVAAPPTVLE
jgi:hypothetical protein